MKVAVWDTYVKKANGNVLHFDILVPKNINDPTIIFKYGQQFLNEKGINDELSSDQCQYCHTEETSIRINSIIKQKGYYILEIEEIPEKLPLNPSKRDMILFLKAHYKIFRFENFKGVSEEDVRDTIKKIVHE